MKRVENTTRRPIALTDLEKVFDRVNRLMWIILEKKGYPRHLITVVKGLYEETRITNITGVNIKTNQCQPRRSTWRQV